MISRYPTCLSRYSESAHKVSGSQKRNCTPLFPRPSAAAFSRNDAASFSLIIKGTSQNDDSLLMGRVHARIYSDCMMIVAHVSNCYKQQIQF